MRERCENASFLCDASRIRQNQRWHHVKKLEKSILCWVVSFGTIHAYKNRQKRILFETDVENQRERTKIKHGLERVL